MVPQDWDTQSTSDLAIKSINYCLTVQGANSPTSKVDINPIFELTPVALSIGQRDVNVRYTMRLLMVPIKVTKPEVRKFMVPERMILSRASCSIQVLHNIPRP